MLEHNKYSVLFFFNIAISAFFKLLLFFKLGSNEGERWKSNMKLRGIPGRSFVRFFVFPVGRAREGAEERDRQILAVSSDSPPALGIPVKYSQVGLTSSLKG